MLLYTTLVHQAIADMARTLPYLRHIAPRRVLVLAAARGSTSRYGNLAQCYGLRQREELDFGYWYHRKSRRVVRVTSWFQRRNTRVTIRGEETLYIVLLRLPRLLEHDPLTTLAHELIHIGPHCDGRLRALRHGKRFEAIVAETARIWRQVGDPQLVEALQMPYAALVERWGALAGLGFSQPFVHPRLCRPEIIPPHREHPDFRRKGLLVDFNRIETVEPEWTPEDVPAELTERDLVYRLYSPTGAQRISATAVHCDPHLFPRVTTTGQK